MPPRPLAEVARAAPDTARLRQPCLELARASLGRSSLSRPHLVVSTVGRVGPWTELAGVAPAWSPPTLPWRSSTAPAPGGGRPRRPLAEDACAGPDGAESRQPCLELAGVGLGRSSLLRPHLVVSTVGLEAGLRPASIACQRPDSGAAGAGVFVQSGGPEEVSQ
jgi:hypothetical protein